MAIGSVEVSHPYGGHWTLTAQGDLVIVQDTLDAAPATQQRLSRLLQTNPTQYADDGTPIARPDDLFHPTYGIGIGSLVGESIQKVEQEAPARALQVLTQDAGIASSPPPTATVQDLGGGNALLTVSVTTSTGQSVATSLEFGILPSLP